MHAVPELEAESATFYPWLSAVFLCAANEMTEVILWVSKDFLWVSGYVLDYYVTGTSNFL